MLLPQEGRVITVNTWAGSFFPSLHRNRCPTLFRLGAPWPPGRSSQQKLIVRAWEVVRNKSLLGPPLGALWGFLVTPNGLWRQRCIRPGGKVGGSADRSVSVPVPHPSLNWLARPRLLGPRERSLGLPGRSWASSWASQPAHPSSRQDKTFGPCNDTRKSKSDEVKNTWSSAWATPRQACL